MSVSFSTQDTRCGYWLRGYHRGFLNGKKVINCYHLLYGFPNHATIYSCLIVEMLLYYVQCYIDKCNIAHKITTFPVYLCIE